jgi:hypothetical protein
MSASVRPETPLTVILVSLVPVSWSMRWVSAMLLKVPPLAGEDVMGGE